MKEDIPETNSDSADPSRLLRSVRSESPLGVI